MRIRMVVRSMAANSSGIPATALDSIFFDLAPIAAFGRRKALRGAVDCSTAPRPTSPPAGATDAGRQDSVEVGTGCSPVPRVRCAGGGDGCRRNAPIFSVPPIVRAPRPGQRCYGHLHRARSGAAEGNGNEPSPRVGFHTHQHAVLAFGARLTEGLAHFG